MSEQEKNSVSAARASQLSAWAKEFHRSAGEEWANASTHLLGVVFSIFALTFMCVITGQLRAPAKIVSGAIYGASLLLLYSSSMLYHLIWKWRVKAVFQELDHISIYLLISGSYTPFALVTLGGTGLGWWVLGISWGLCLLGILAEIFCKPRKEWLTLTITLLMGWQIIFCFKPVFTNLNTVGLAMLIVGGGVYTLGVIFYIMDKVPYMHTVWHVFTLGGSVCHWVAITFGVLTH